MSTKAYLLVLVVLFVAGVAGAAAEHDPIVILGDSDMTEANGVTAGSGTVDDPYIVSGWEIDGSTSEYGVRVENVTGYFVLRGLVVQAATNTGGAAIRIGFSSNGVIEECTVLSSINGIELTSSTSITIRNTAL